MIRLRWLVFLISWKKTSKPMVVHHSELAVLRCFSGTIATCPIFAKKLVIICLKVLRKRTTFVGFRSSLNIHTAHRRKSTIHHLSRCYRRVSKHCDCIFKAFLSTNCHEPFFERLTNCVGSNANTFFHSQMFMQY